MDIKNFRDLFNKLPKELQKRVYNLKTVPQNPKWHPEGNTLKHVITVVNRSLKYNDIDLAIAAIMHDIGKDITFKPHPKTGLPTAYGHENVSADLVKKYRKWIESMGADYDTVYYIVKNHMRYKQLNIMKPSKVAAIQSHPNYDKLCKFGNCDKGGLKEYGVGQLFAGKLKIGGNPVDVEVELIGADNKKKVFITRIIHIDKRYLSKLPSNGILEIPARVFRVPGGGWRRIKSPTAFENLMMGYPDQEWLDKHAEKLRKLRKQIDKQRMGIR
jgi:hypothetical protein